MVGLKSAVRTFASLSATLFAVAMLVASQPVLAQHKMNADDMELPTNDMKVVEAGKAKFAQRCSFCHGGNGKGGKGPCLSCGTFHYTGNTNSEIYATIAAGVPKSIGGTMGAFGTTMSQEEIVSVITFLRWEENRRIAAGEIPDPKKSKADELPVFPTTN
jgi:mono/diheme cytochrome c family protein